MRISRRAILPALAIAYLVFGLISQGFGSQVTNVLTSEQTAWCQIYSCEQDDFHRVTKRKETGSIHYYVFEPRGAITPVYRFRGGSRSLSMYIRPHTTPSPDPVWRDYDEVWIDETWADIDANNRLSSRDKIADVLYLLEGR